MISNIDKLAEDLEKQEIESPNGIPPPQVYAQLLAIYLYQNDLCNAKYLWKRIPASVKTSHPELAQVWNVGQHMWKRDYPATYTALSAVQWPEQIAEIMKALMENVRNRAINLIAQAYSSLSMDTVVTMTGLNQEQVHSTCSEHGWSVESDTRMVLPCKPPPAPTSDTSSEDQLYKLTEFVSFLEN